jgi:type I restriction enzyme R subunit
MIDEIQTRFNISDEEALYIKQVTELKVADPAIRSTVQAHREDIIYLEGAYRGQVNGEIQGTYNGLARYDELADPKYTDTGGIFDIMAVTVIETHLTAAA